MRWRHPLCQLLALVFVGGLLWRPVVAFAAESAASAASGSREFYSTNSGQRLLVTVQVWGDVQLAGTHHVPDNLSLIDLISLAGGPQGPADKTSVTVKRVGRQASAEAGPAVHTFEFTGEDLIHTNSANQFRLAENDIVYVQVDKSEDKFLKTLSVASLITGLISSVLITVFLLQTHAK